MSSSSVRSLADASRRWSLSPEVVREWRTRLVAAQSNPPPKKKTKRPDDASKEALLDVLKLKQQEAEARLARLQAQAAGDEQIDDDDDDEEEDEKQPAEAKDDGDSESSDSSDSGSDGDSDEEDEYENELEYFAHEILCLDAISHDLPEGKEVQCPYCKDGKKFESEFACSTCAFVRGVCASCRRVVVLRSLADPAQGAAVCLALLADETLLRATLELESDEDEEADAARAQMEFMLDAYFDKA